MWRTKPKPFINWEYCTGCECWMLICPKCGNNCCNGGHGEVTNFYGVKTDCDMCAHVYELQHWAWNTQKEPLDPFWSPKIKAVKRFCRRELEKIVGYGQ